MKKRLLSLLAVLLLALPAFAQKDFRPGYVVTLQNDTINGLVDYRGDKKNATICLFKTTETASEETFYPHSLNGYGFHEGKRYQTQDLTNQAGAAIPTFLNVLVQGKASLFFYRDSLGADHFYLKQNENLQPLEQIIQIKTDPKTGVKTKVTDKQFQKVLAENFKDCLEIYALIQKTELKTSNLIKVTSAYNSCSAPGTSMYVQQPTPSKITTGVVFGAHATSLVITGDTYLSKAEKYESAISPHLGFFFNFTLPRVNEKLSVHTEVMAAKNKFESSFAEKGSHGNVNNYDVLFDLIYVKAPVQLRYTYPRGKIKPFVNVGLMNGFAFKATQKTTKVSTFGSTVREEELMPLASFRKYTQALTAGIGFKYNAKPKMPLFAEFRYEAGNGFSYATAIETAVNAYYLNFGIQF